MLKVKDGLKIYIYSYAVDMRKAINGLSALILDELKLQPDSGSVYIFWNKRLDKLKVLFYDRNGFVLYYKILNKKKFSIIKSENLNYCELTVEQLDWMLAGLDLECMHNFPEIRYRYFY